MIQNIWELSVGLDYVFVADKPEKPCCVSDTTMIYRSPSTVILNVWFILSEYCLFDLFLEKHKDEIMFVFLLKNNNKKTKITEALWFMSSQLSRCLLRTISMANTTSRDALPGPGWDATILLCLRMEAGSQGTNLRQIMAWSNVTTATFLSVYDHEGMTCFFYYL